MNKIKTAFILMICINLQIVFSQDIDVFERNLNDHFNIPQIADSMSFEEFKTLSTNLRLMDDMEAIVVPGLIHFKVKDKTTAWILAGTRLTGYGGLIYVNFHKDGIWADAFNYQTLNSEESKTDYYIALAAVGLIAGSYLYDWIHGRSLLDKKQQKIRFKYAIKLHSSTQAFPHAHTGYFPELALKLSF
ncbi:MAG: hypothetical protein JXR27_06895 [Paludibacteraceae bacterium]|nr:hypothetical protein [Paludibacteraceae bacterium]